MKRRAFTLIELLVVIAIIAILAAITFPVFARSKEAAYRSSDISNMNQLRTALQLYRADQGAYPPSIMGYATGYSNFTPSDADIIPADQAVSALFPRRVDSLETLRPAFNRVNNPKTSFTTAVWPNAWNDPSVADPLRQQRFGPETTVSRCIGATQVTNYYYTISGYDVATVQTPAGNRTELRYAPFWSGYAVPADCSGTTGNGSANDDPRQLGYSEPPETTVITWNSFFRQYNAGTPTAGRQEVVLFLGGGARPFDSSDVALKSWRVTP